MGDIVAWVQANWITIVAAGWALEKLLEIIAELTPWKWDDNLGVILGKLLGAIGGKKPS